ncbi:MAG: hypothetical protein ACE5K2_02645, partial [Candidatus Zixiibacteriota bacterium]
MLKKFFILTLSILLIYASPLFATRPPLDVKLTDTPNDRGESITLIFERTVKDTWETEYEIWRSAEEENNFQMVGKILSSDEKFIDSEVKDGVNYFYFIKGTGENDTLISAVFGPVVSKGQWFNTRQINVLLA